MVCLEDGGGSVGEYPDVGEKRDIKRTVRERLI
jgi:hypothetical protein